MFGLSVAWYLANSTSKAHHEECPAAFVDDVAIATFLQASLFEVTGAILGSTGLRPKSCAAGAKCDDCYADGWMRLRNPEAATVRCIQVQDTSLTHAKPVLTDGSA